MIAQTELLEYLSQRVETIERRLDERGIGGNTLDWNVKWRERAMALESELQEAIVYANSLEKRMQEIRKVAG